MKLQLDGNNLRVRLSEDQLAVLLRDGRLASSFPCPNGESAGRVLILEADAAAPACEGDLLDLRLRLPRETFLAFVSERPRRDGFSFTAKGVEFRVEIDLRDSRRRLAASPM